MITLQIPGYLPENLHLSHLVLDFNGTLAIDGKLIDGVKEPLQFLSEKIQLHVVTGNSFGTAEHELKGFPVKLTLLNPQNQSQQKAEYIKTLGPENVVSIGNGRNDRKMVKDSAIGIVVIQKEGTSAETIVSGDIICPDILDALDLLNNPQRMVATLRG